MARQASTDWGWPFSRLRLNDTFLRIARKHFGWKDDGRLETCDRCGATPAHPVGLGDPVDVVLSVCAECDHWLRQEMRRPTSGQLGVIMLAAIAALNGERASRLPKV